jgi:hypothetical protein
MAYWLPYILLLILGCMIGVLVGIYDPSPNWVLIAVLTFMLAFSILWGRNLYILYRTNNMALVEKLLNQYRKRPYIAFLMEVLNGNYEQAERHIANIRNGQQKMLAMTIIHIQHRRYEQAKAENQNVKNEDIRYYNSALIALQEGDQEGFRLAKNKVKSEATRTILMAEEAFKRGNFQEAERLGDAAISLAAGMKRYVLLKSLERERNNPDRESYF